MFAKYIWAIRYAHTYWKLFVFSVLLVYNQSRQNIWPTRICESFFFVSFVCDLCSENVLYEGNIECALKFYCSHAFLQLLCKSRALVTSKYYLIVLAYWNHRKYPEWESQMTCHSSSPVGEQWQADLKPQKKQVLADG